MMDTRAHVYNVVDKYNSVYFYQRVSIVRYASADIARGGTSVCPFGPSVTLQYYIKTKKAILMIFHHLRARTF